MDRQYVKAKTAFSKNVQWVKIKTFERSVCVWLSVGKSVDSFEPEMFLFSDKLS